MNSAPIDELDDDDVETDADVDGQDAEEKVRLDLGVQVSSPSACERHVSVTVPREDIERYFGKAIDEMTPKAAVPGFRQGRAPRKLVQSHFRKELKDQIKGQILLDSVSQVNEEQKFAAISEPDFDFEAIELPDSGDMTFEFNLEVRPDFEIPNWKGLRIQRPSAIITDRDVEKRMQLIFSSEETVPSEEPVAMGDTVVGDLECRFQGESIAHQPGVTILVRQDLTFPDGTWQGFGKALVGCRPGDRRAATIPVSKDAPEERFRGEEVEAVFNVLEVRKPALAPESAWSRLGFAAEDQFRDFVRDNLLRQMKYQQDRRIREQITSQLTEAASWELPPELLKRQAQRELERAVIELRSSGFTESDIASRVNLLRQQSRTTTARALKEHFVLERIAESESIEATDEDFEVQLADLAARSGLSVRAMRARVEKRGIIDVIRNQIVESKVIDLIREHAQFTDVPYQPEESTSTALENPITGHQGAEIPVAKHAGDARELTQPAERV